MDGWSDTITVNINGNGSNIYYMSYALGQHFSGNNYTYNGNNDGGWTNEKLVKVKIKNISGVDTLVYYDSEEPVVLDFYWKHCVLPAIDVMTELPDGYDPNLGRREETDTTPKWLSVDLKALDTTYWKYNTYWFRTGQVANGAMIQNIPAGRSVIGSPLRRYRYLDYLYKSLVQGQTVEYTDVPVIGTFYQKVTTSGDYEGRASLGEEYCYGYRDQSVIGYPVGDYELQYSVGSSDIQEKWESASGVKVHLAEDGKLYRIKDDGTYETDPYVILIRYIGGSVRCDKGISQDSGEYHHQG